MASYFRLVPSLIAPQEVHLRYIQSALSGRGGAGGGGGGGGGAGE